MTKIIMEMKENNKFGFLSQGYAAPRAESVAVAQESVLCASPIDGVTAGTYEIEEIGNW